MTVRSNIYSNSNNDGPANWSFQIGLPNGEASMPSWHFSGETNTGFYKATTGMLNVSIQGTEAYRFDTAGGFLTPNGTSALPGMAFLNDRDTGLFLATTNSIGFAIGGTSMARLFADGSLGLNNSGYYGFGTNPDTTSAKFFIRFTSDDTPVLTLTQDSSNTGTGTNQVEIRTAATGATAKRFWAGIINQGTTADLTARVDTDGTFRSDSTYETTGADYAEMFEWSDGNPSQEDRRGMTVSLVGDKIRVAQAGDTVIGVVSSSPSIVGNSPIEWPEKFQKDKFGNYLKNQSGVRVVNPNYDPRHGEYQVRSRRSEWAPIGLNGKLRILAGQITGSGWVKIRNLPNNIEEWLVK